jgi:isoleucyl-tRNA synthetase
MAGYRDTLNLPRTDFPMKADLPRREPERLAWWRALDLDRKRWSLRRGRPVLLLHDGPPYSNDHIHMGTAANKIWKDALVRSAALLGFDSPYLPGWDNHGLPIEVRVARERRERGEPEDQLALRRRCRAFAAEWVDVQRREFIRLGVGGPWGRPYLTMDPGFEADILEALAALVERGFVERGLRSIHWCPTDRTALAEAEIEYRDVSSPSIHVTFPLAHDPGRVLGGDAEAVAWTTTPWTLPANLGLMVDPQAEYVVARAATPGADRAGPPRRFLVAAGRLAAVAEAAGWEAPVVERTIPGRDLLGLAFTGPWERPSRVVDGTPFVSLDEGTGLVHTAPGHGKEDFAVGMRAGLGVLSPVDEAGRLTAGAEPFVGRGVLEADDDIVAWLRGKGRLLAASRLLHAYPHCWRCRGPVIFRATRQWFMMIDNRGHRERALEAIERAVRWEPEGSRNRIRDAVRLRPDWCLSRQRSWGVGIPALYCEACGEASLDRRVIAAAARLTREHGSDVWYELPAERFAPADFACPSCGARGPFRKERDILDVWFDSGCSHRAAAATHPELAEVWRRAVAEGGRIVYFEGPDQHRGWFNSSLMVGVATAERAPYTDVLTHGWVLDAQGRAMHKSLGNVIAPGDLIRRYGADIVRWWALSADWRADVRIGAEILERVADAYRKIRNTFRFLLGNLHDFSPGDALPAAELTAVDRAFAAQLGVRIERLREDYVRFLFHRVADALLEICTVDLSSVFLDAAKDRLYALRPDDPGRRSAQTVLWRALHDLAIAASPLLAFTAEEVWQSHAALRAEAESVHLASWPDAAPPDPERAEDWRLLLEARAAANAAIEPLRAQKTLATTLEAEVDLSLPPRAAERLLPYRDELPGFLLVARAGLAPDPAAAAPTAVARRTRLARCDRCWTHRADVRADAAGSSLCARCALALERRGMAGRGV